MPESLLKYRFRGSKLPYEELLIALENIIKDKVMTHPAPKVKKIDTSEPLEVGMAAGTDGEEAFEEGYGKSSELAVQTVYKGIEFKGGWNGGKGPSWRVQKDFNSGRQERRKRAGEKVAKVTTEFAGAVGKQDTLRQTAPRGVGTGVWTLQTKTKETSARKCMKTKMSCTAWCLLEESEKEQWQEVISKKLKLKLKVSC